MQQSWGLGHLSIPARHPSLVLFSARLSLQSPLCPLFPSPSLSTFTVSAPFLCRWALDPNLALFLASDLPGKLFQPTDSVSQISDSAVGPAYLFAPRPDGEPRGGPLPTWAWSIVVEREVRDQEMGGVG